VEHQQPVTEERKLISQQKQWRLTLLLLLLLLPRITDVAVVTGIAAGAAATWCAAFCAPQLLLLLPEACEQLFV
jgi:hypothetical protein